MANERTKERSNEDHSTTCWTSCSFSSTCFLLLVFIAWTLLICLACSYHEITVIMIFGKLPPLSLCINLNTNTKLCETSRLTQVVIVALILIISTPLIANVYLSSIWSFFVSHLDELQSESDVHLSCLMSILRNLLLFVSIPKEIHLFSLKMKNEKEFCSISM